MKQLISILFVLLSFLGNSQNLTINNADNPKKIILMMNPTVHNIQTMQYLGHNYTKKMFVVYLKFKFNWASCIFTW